MDKTEETPEKRGLMETMIRSIISKMIREVQRSENKNKLLDNVINPIVSHVTTFIIGYMKDQFYTQFIIIVIAIGILCIFNILIFTLLIYGRRHS
jgi:hypothetical protein